MDRHNHGWGAGLLMVLAMAVCCGGPLLVLGLVAVGPSVLAAVGAPVGVELAAVTVAAIGAVLALRRAGSCSDCALPGTRTPALDDPVSTTRSRADP